MKQQGGGGGGQSVAGVQLEYKLRFSRSGGGGGMHPADASVTVPVSLFKFPIILADIEPFEVDVLVLTHGGVP